MKPKITEGKCFCGRTLVLATEKVELAVTLDVGPRIISAKRVGGSNIFFEDTGEEITKDCSGVYGKGNVWKIYGGHRLWISPEDETTYVPDNGAVTYTEKGDSVSFTCADWRVKDVAPTIAVTFLDANTVRVEHTLKSLRANNRVAIWALTVCKCGGTLTVPLSAEDTGYVANRNLVLWAYTDIKDKRMQIENDRVVIIGSKGAKGPLKLGLFKREICATYELEGTIFTKKIAVPEGVSGADYPDYNCNFETYTSKLMHEIETLSPLVTLGKGQEITHTEIWSLT